jgi:hypothetical protein
VLERTRKANGAVARWQEAPVGAGADYVHTYDANGNVGQLLRWSDFAPDECDPNDPGGIGGLLGTRDVSDPNAPTNYLYFYDANGNVGQLIDRSDGSLDAKYEYDTYGNTIASAGDYGDGKVSTRGRPSFSPHRHDRRGACRRPTPKPRRTGRWWSP